MRLERKNEFLLSEWLESWTDCGVESPVLVQAPKSLLHVWNCFADANALSSASASEPTENEALPIAADAESSAEILEVVFLISTSLTPQTHTLLARMVTAMGLASNQVGICLSALGPVSLVSEWTDESSLATPAPNRTSRTLVVMGENAEENAQMHSHGLAANQAIPVFNTHSLDAILAQPSLKRAVWEDLQHVMQKLK